MRKLIQSGRTYWKEHAERGIFLGVICLSILFLIIVFNRAWVCDDSYITFRVVDNFRSGYGLRWNVSERVQVYTHPLWLLLMILSHAVTGEVYLTSIFLSVILSLGVIVLFYSAERKNVGVWVGIILLSLSSAFVDFSTSGLENALSHFLLAVFLVMYFHIEKEENERGRNSIFWFSLIAGLGCLNRLDYVLIYIPALGYVFFNSKNRWKTLFRILLGFSPLMLWLLFSTVYYGFPLPNTFYAKLNNWLTPNELMRQGWKYFLHTLRNDPITGLMLCVGLLSSAFHRSKGRTVLSFGALLYLFYVMWIGGDFMEGRFFTGVFLLFVIQLVHYDLPKIKKVNFAWIIPVLVVISLLSSIPTIAFSNWKFEETWEDGVVNERFFYAKETALFRNRKFNWYPEHPWVWEGTQLKERCHTKDICYIPLYSVGFSGYYAGPDVYIVDRYGLGSALIARIPPEITPEWRIGHFIRQIPVGYMEYLRTDDLTYIPNLAIQKDIEQMDLITKAPIFSPRRMKTIFRLHGQNDNLAVPKKD